MPSTSDFIVNVPSEIIAALIGVAAMFLVNFFYNPQKQKNDQLSRKVDDLAIDLSNYKLSVSERFVTQAHLDAQMLRLEKGLDEVKAMLQVMIEKK